MVADSPTAIGLDRQDETIHLAEVQIHSERERILGLRMLSEIENDPWSGSSLQRLVVAVPDKSVIVKRVSVPESLAIPVEDYSRFELEQSLLDPPHEFILDHYHVHGERFALGFAIRRCVLEETLRNYGMTNGAQASQTIGCRTRALALGLGYLTFCVAEPGHVTGLADIGPTSVSLCLIHDHRLVSVAHLGADGYDATSYDGRHRLAIELRTVFNFLTDSSRSSDISQPLSNLVVSGPALTQDLQDVISAYFPGGVCRPKINTGFLANPSDLDHIEVERFLVALGLTVK